MASYTDITAPSVISGVWNKKDTICRLMEDGIRVDVQVETHPSYDASTNFPVSTLSQHTIINNTRSSCYPACDHSSPSRDSMASLPPSYSSVVYDESGTEPQTLARMLFKYGFLCFPFWIAGVCILYMPLRPTPEWESGKSEAEKTQQLAFLRKIELKWARRCLSAIYGVAVLVFLSTLIIKYGILRQTS